MVAISTPMDTELAELNRKIGTTLVAYGSLGMRREVAAKQVASEAAPATVVADRLSFNTKSGKAVQEEGELLDTLASGKLKLADVKKEELPTEWQKLDDTQLTAEVAKKQADAEYAAAAPCAERDGGDVEELQGRLARCDGLDADERHHAENGECACRRIRHPVKRANDSSQRNHGRPLFEYTPE